MTKLPLFKWLRKRRDKSMMSSGFQSVSSQSLLNETKKPKSLKERLRKGLGFSSKKKKKKRQPLPSLIVTRPLPDIATLTKPQSLNPPPYLSSHSNGEGTDSESVENVSRSPSVSGTGRFDIVGVTDIKKSSSDPVPSTKAEEPVRNTDDNKQDQPNTVSEIPADEEQEEKEEEEVVADDILPQCTIEPTLSNVEEEMNNDPQTPESQAVKVITKLVDLDIEETKDPELAILEKEPEITMLEEPEITEEDSPEIDASEDETPNETYTSLQEDTNSVATQSLSGSGSVQELLWLTEVKQAIAELHNKKEGERDRYSVSSKDGSMTAETVSDTDDNNSGVESVSGVEQSEASIPGREDQQAASENGEQELKYSMTEPDVASARKSRSKETKASKRSSRRDRVSDEKRKNKETKAENSVRPSRRARRPRGSDHKPRKKNSEKDQDIIAESSSSSMEPASERYQSDAESRRSPSQVVGENQGDSSDDDATIKTITSLQLVYNRIFFCQPNDACGCEELCRAHEDLCPAEDDDSSNEGTDSESTASGESNADQIWQCA